MMLAIAIEGTMRPFNKPGASGDTALQDRCNCTTQRRFQDSHTGRTNSDSTYVVAEEWRTSLKCIEEIPMTNCCKKRP